MSKSTIISTDLLLSASTAAYRINDYKYVKSSDRMVYDEDSRSMVPNSQYKEKNADIVKRLVFDSELITEIDRDFTSKMKTFIQSIMTVKIIKDSLSDFDNKILKMVSETECDISDIHIASYLPEFYQQELNNQSLKSKLYECQREYVGEPNSKVSTTIEILKSTYSKKYNCMFYTAITHDNKTVRFAYSGRTNIEVNKKYLITAQVKRYENDWVTVLKRVKFTPLDNKSQV